MPNRARCAGRQKPKIKGKPQRNGMVKVEPKQTAMYQQNRNGKPQTAEPNRIAISVG